MPESLRSRIRRWRLNFFPAFRGTGARLTYLADDFREARLRLPLNWRTRNYVGTIFGGSMYAAVDPFYMVMLIENLGDDYMVWDKAGRIRFRRPGRDTLYARFLLEQRELDAIRRELEAAESTERLYEIALADGEGVVHAEVEKTIHVRRRADAAG